ncbi:MAG: hypothetical protein HY094_01400 [Candidatus Melainabacteria bacterium]|nr:hypothetical protein [Candidatus Melainabacteria bacterium]
MNILKAVTTDTVTSLHHGFNLLWSKISPILLPLILILVFLSIGLWVANFLSDKIGALVKKAKLDDLLDRIFAPVLKLTGTKINSSSMIQGTIKWFLIGTVLIAALDLADLKSVINFLNQILSYLPSVFIAALILAVGSMVSNLAAVIVGTVSKGNFATTAKVAVNVLAFIAALSQLVTPIIGSLGQFIGHLSLSKLQADVLFVGVLVLALLASKNAVAKTVESLYKT